MSGKLSEILGQDFSTLTAHYILECLELTPDQCNQNISWQGLGIVLFVLFVLFYQSLGWLFTHNRLPSKGCFLPLSYRHTIQLCWQLGLPPYHLRYRISSGSTVRSGYLLTAHSRLWNPLPVFCQRAQKWTEKFLAYLPSTSRISRLQFIHD